jgi:glyoxylase-like metal-dependent hydrolase (beta-lactamase superfamily II)
MDTVPADQPRIVDLRFLGRPGVVAAFLLQGDGEAALIEVGPSSTIDTLLGAIDAAGIPRQAVRHLLVTHIHLDHAGAAGLLLQALPAATLYAHEIGVPHLIDPSKLIASASRIYGALMQPLWGEIVPVPAHRLVALQDNAIVQAAGHRFQSLYTPGHAQHHLAYRDLETGAIYTGDVGGVRMPPCTYVRPPTPPPDLDLDAWDRSLDRLASFAAPVFYATHFGRCDDTPAHLEDLRTRLRAWERLVLAGMQAGQDHTAITLTLQRSGDDEIARSGGPELLARYEMASGYSMNVSGYERYLRKRHPDLPVPDSSR